MSTACLEDLRAIWRQMAQRNDWELVHNEEEFLQCIRSELERLDVATPPDSCIRVAVFRSYGLLLYEGIQNRQDRAAYELWLSCYRITLREGWSTADAEVAAQETITQVLAKLHTLRMPQSLLAWTLRICRSVRLALRKDEDAKEPLEPEHAPSAEIPDRTDIPVEVEQHLFNQQLHILLRNKLTNPLERLVLLRIVLIGDHPRDVAHDLGLPLHRTRVAKFRALQRLRGDEQVIQLLNRLPGEAPYQMLAAGEHDDDS